MGVGGVFSRGGGVLWANDGSGLVYSAQGVMEWLPTDGNPPVRLPLWGIALRWGPYRLNRYHDQLIISPAFVRVKAAQP